jgi:hypothetical protein
MTNEEIINSSAFNVLNHMIDEKADLIIRYLPWFKDEVNRLFSPEAKYKGCLRTRTHEEGADEIDLPVNIYDLKSLIDRLTDVLKDAEQIGELQRQKLRLLNDYDFTHGDDTEQKKIFG